MKQPVNDKDAKAETVVRAETVVMEGGRRLSSVIYGLETAVNTIHKRQSDAFLDRQCKGEPVKVKAGTIVMEDGSTLDEVVELLETSLVDVRAESEGRLVDAGKVVMRGGVTLAGVVDDFQKDFHFLKAREESFEAELHRVACAQSEAAMRERGIDRQSHESVQRLIKELHGLLEAQSRRIAYLESLNDMVFNQELERRTQRTTADPHGRYAKTAHGRFDANEGRRFDVGELGINDRFE